MIVYFQDSFLGRCVVSNVKENPWTHKAIVETSTDCHRAMGAEEVEDLLRKCKTTPFEKGLQMGYID